MDGNFEGAFGGVHLAGEGGVGDFGLAEEEGLEEFEVFGAAVAEELAAQVFDDAVEDGEHPAALEDALGGFLGGGFALVALFAGGEFEGDEEAAAAFLRALAVLFVGDEVFQRGQDEGAKAAFGGVGAVEVAAFQEAEEELLGEVLGLIGRGAAAAQVGVERIPVASAERDEGGVGIFTFGIAGGDDQRPSGGWELRGSGCRVASKGSGA